MQKNNKKKDKEIEEMDEEREIDNDEDESKGAESQILISSICVVPKGGFNLNPKKEKLTEEEIKEYLEKEENMGDEEIDEENINTKEEGFEKVMENLQLAEKKAFDEDDDESSEAEENYQIDEDDIMSLVLENDDEQSLLQVYIYEKEFNNLYVHHDILLNSFSLCCEWIGIDPKEKSKGNFCAIGGFVPDIEIWDIDVIEKSFATTILKTPNEEAILTLSWNNSFKQFLVSGGANTRVNLWDIVNNKLVRSVDHHKDKVQSVLWHPKESNVLISGGFDKTCKLYDPSKNGKILNFNVDSPVEEIKWNPNSSEQFLAGLESGNIIGYDIRNNSKPLYYFKGHEKSVSDLSFCSIDDLIITCSEDGFLNAWYLSQNIYKSDKKPQDGVRLYSKNMRRSIYSIDNRDGVIFYGGKGKYEVSKAFMSKEKLEKDGEKHTKKLEIQKQYGSLKNKKRVEKKKQKNKEKLEKKMKNEEGKKSERNVEKK